MEYNAKLTQEKAQSASIRLYVEWLKQNGAIFDKIQFPAVYGDD